MSVMINKENDEMITSCSCGCDNGVHIKVKKDSEDSFCFISYMNGNFYRDQGGIFHQLHFKMKKIWAIIRNRDFYYSEVIMRRSDFTDFKNYIDDVYEKYIK